MFDTLSLLTANPIITFVIAVIIVALLVYIFVNKKGLLCKAALYAVSVAEDEWGSDMGRVKFAEAYTYIKKQFPLLTLFLPEAKLTQIIEDALVELKKILATKAAKTEAAKQQTPTE